MIRGVLVSHAEVTGALIFGSRAKGTAREASDVDLSVEGIDDPLTAEAIASELDGLPPPFLFDVKALPSIRHRALREHIDRVRNQDLRLNLLAARNYLVLAPSIFSCRLLTQALNLLAVPLYRKKSDWVSASLRQEDHMKSLLIVIALLLGALAGQAVAADFGMWDLSVGKVVTPTSYAVFDPTAPNVKIVGAPISYAGAPDLPIPDPFAYHGVNSGDLAALGAAVYVNDAASNYVPPGPDAVDAGFPDTGFLYVSHLVSNSDGTWRYKCLLYPAVATSDAVTSTLVSQSDLVNGFVNNTTTYP